MASKAMDVLVQLARAAPSVLSNDALLDRVWPDVIVVDNVLHQAVRRLRRSADRLRVFVELVEAGDHTTLFSRWSARRP